MKIGLKSFCNIPTFCKTKSNTAEETPSLWYSLFRSSVVKSTNQFTENFIRTFALLRVNSQIKLSSVFHLQDQISKNLLHLALIKNSTLCSDTYYAETVRYWVVKSGKHFALPHLTNKKVKPKRGPIKYHLLLYNHT